MTVMYSPLLVADYMLAKNDGNVDLTPLQVNKLTYISHGFALAIYNTKLVADDVEAWRYGPVFPQLYYALRHYGGNTIPHLSYCNTGIDTDQINDRYDFFKHILDNKTEIIDMVLNTYGKLSASELIERTHRKGTPWKKHYRKGSYGIIIPSEHIKQHYLDIINCTS